MGAPRDNSEQLGLLFGTPRPASARPAEPRPAPARDTLPAWARAAMPRSEPAPQPRVWSVAELVGDVRERLHGAYGELLVRGEVSNLRAAPSGHLYFTLKDGEAQLPAVMFRRAAQSLRFRVKDGMEVLLRGELSVYEQRGQVQLIAESLEPIGAGSWQVAFDQLKAKLAAEGLFAPDRKRSLPPFPRCVGIVTSPTGAVIRDFLHVAARRHPALHVLLFPAAVQGEGSPAEVAAGIAWFNRARSVDIIVLARGGGSLEDLAAFNSETVARAIAASTIPVVSAVGHQTDFTIADFVADLRAPTPSAAAELVTAAQQGIHERLALLRGRLAQAARYACAQAHRRFSILEAAAGLSRVRASLGRRAQRLDELRFRLERAQTAQAGARCARLDTLQAALRRVDPARRMAEARARLLALEPRLRAATLARLNRATLRTAEARSRVLRAHPQAQVQAARRLLAASHGRLLHAAEARLQAAVHRAQTSNHMLLALSPRAVMQRGYALVFAENGSLITAPSHAAEGQTIEVELFAGRLRARVLATSATGEI